MANGKRDQAPSQVTAQSISRMSAGLLATAIILVVPLLVLVYLYLSELNRELQTLEKQRGSVGVLQQWVALQIHHIDDYYGRYYPSREAMQRIYTAEASGEAQAPQLDQALWDLQLSAMDEILADNFNQDRAEWRQLKAVLQTLGQTDTWSAQLAQLSRIEPLADQLAKRLLLDANLVWSRSEPVRRHSSLLFVDLLLAKQALLLSTEKLAQTVLDVREGDLEDAIRQLQNAMTQLENIEKESLRDTSGASVQLEGIELSDIAALGRRILEKKRRLNFIGALDEESGDMGLALEVEKLRGLSWDKYSEFSRAQLQLAGSLNKILSVELDKQKQWRAVVIFWVALLVLTATFLGGYIVHNIRITQLFLGAENLQLEARVKSRTEEIVAAKNEAEQLNRILGKQTQISTELARKAEMASSAKSLFLAAMSHEIRTPLNAVLGGARILAKTALDSRQKSILTLITQSGKTLLELINEILDFSKIEANQLELDSHPFNLEELLLDIVSMFSLKAKEKNVRLGLFFDSRCEGEWKGDALRIKQIIINLLSNAVKFTDNGGISVRVGLSDDQHLLISVEDTGVGIKSEHLNNLFEAFVQSDSSTTRKYGGTGLGLSISRRLAEMHGGNISVVSTLGKGSTFVVALPLSRVDAQPVLEVADKVGICLLSDQADLERQLRQWYGRIHVVTELAEVERHLFDVPRSQKAHWVVVAESTTLIKTRTQHDTQPFLEKIETIAREVPWVLLTSQDAIDSDDMHDLSKELRALNIRIQLPLLSSGKLIRKAILCAAEHRDDAAFNWGDPEASDSARYFSGRVLLAEDVEFNRIIAREILEASGLEVDCVNDGDQAVKYMWRYYNQPEADRTPVKLILMDLHMPELNGLDATRKIREMEQNWRLAPMPIVAMTADALVDTRQRIIDVGMDGYLPKPFEEEELIGILSRYFPANVEPQQASHPNARALVHDAQREASQSVARSTPQSVVAETSPKAKTSDDPVFDHEALLNRVRGRSDRLAELTQSFLSSLPASLENIEGLIQTEAYKELIFAAHTLKGSSANLGAVEMQQCVSRMESLARQLDTKHNPLQVEKLAAEWQILQHSAERLTRAMETHLESLAAGA